MTEKEELLTILGSMIFNFCHEKSRLIIDNMKDIANLLKDILEKYNLFINKDEMLDILGQVFSFFSKHAVID